MAAFDEITFNIHRGRSATWSILWNNVPQSVVHYGPLWSIKNTLLKRSQKPQMHCSEKGPYFRDQVPIENFWIFGSLLGPFLYLSVPIFSVLAKFTLWTAVPYMLIIKSFGLLICKDWFCVTFCWIFTFPSAKVYVLPLLACKIS